MEWLEKFCNYAYEKITFPENMKDALGKWFLNSLFPFCSENMVSGFTGCTDGQQTQKTATEIIITKEKEPGGPNCWSSYNVKNK